MSLFVILLVGIIIADDRGRLPFFIAVAYDIPYGDKAGHFIMMGILNLLVTRLMLARNPVGSWRVAVLTGLVVAVLVALEEYSQRFFPNRHASWGDLAASLTGIIVFGFAAWLMANKGARRIETP